MVATWRIVFTFLFRFNSFFSLSLMFKQILSFSFDFIMYFDDSIGYILSNISDLCQSKTFWWVNIYLTLVSVVKTSYYFGDNFIFRMPCAVLRLCVYTSCVYFEICIASSKRSNICQILIPWIVPLYLHEESTVDWGSHLMKWRSLAWISFSLSPCCQKSKLI